MVDFETLLIKNLLNDSEFFSKVFSIMQAKYFNDFAHSKLFSLIKQYYTKYKEIPSEISLVPLIRDTQNADVRKQLAECLKLVHHTEIVNNTQFMLDETVKYIKDRIYLEALTIGSEGLAEKSDTKKQKAQKLFEDMAKVSIDESMGLQFSDIEEMIRYYQERNIGILTQHEDINKHLGTGFLPGTLSVIMASQSVGKSLLMCDLISGVLLQKKNALLVSLEMSDHEMMKRIHANVFNIDVNSFTDIGKTEQELSNVNRSITSKQDILNAFNRVKNNVGKLYVKDYPAGSFTSLMLEDLVQRIQTKENLKFDIIFVDYLGIMKSDLVSPSIGLYSYVKSIGEELRASAKKLNVPIITCSQLNRSSVNKTENVDNSAVADSIGTMMTVDFSLFLLQNEEMKAKSEIICKVTKNRFNGLTDSFMMTIDYPHMKFKEMLKNSDEKAIKKMQENSSFGLSSDFGIVTPSKMDNAVQFANTEVKNLEDDFLKTLDLL